MTALPIDYVYTSILYKENKMEKRQTKKEQDARDSTATKRLKSRVLRKGKVVGAFKVSSFVAQVPSPSQTLLSQLVDVQSYEHG